MNNKLKFDQVLSYGLPGLPLAMLGLPLFVYLPSYYSQDLGLSLAAVGIALLLARSLDVITDPLIGLLNDRYPRSRTSLWRRNSYIIVGVPLLLVGLNFLLRPSENVTIFYLFIWSFITYLGWTLINIPWLALGAEISDDYHEKSALASSREIFAVIGTVMVISLPVILSIQSDLRATLNIIASLLTFLIPLALLPLLLKLKSWKTFSKTLGSRELDPTKLDLTETRSNKNIAERDQLSFTSTLKVFSDELLAILKYPAIKRLLPAYLVNSIANALPATLFILFVSHVLQTPEKVGILLISYFVSAIAGIPLWLYIARKTDKHTSWCIALIGAIVSFIWVPFLDAGDFYPFLLVCLATGFFLGADVVMPASIQADISQHISKNNIELNTHESINGKNNKDSTALLFGLWGLLTKLALALAIGISFPLLDLVGLNTDVLASQNPNENATLTLMVLYALIPVVLKIWVLFQMWHFPFNKRFFSDFSLKKTSTKKGNNNEHTKTATLNRFISNISTFKRV